MHEETNREVNIKHLEFIESAIGRMAQNSFHAKTWCISVFTALVAFYFSQYSQSESLYYILILAVVSVLFFAAIDAYYLYLERGFRYLYDTVARLNDEQPVANYSMEIPKSARGGKNFWKALESRTVLFFYGILELVIVISAVLLLCSVYLHK